MELPQNQEIWRAVDGYVNYEVSSHGRVRNAISGRLLTPFYDGQHYAKVRLYEEKKKKDFLVHRLVAMAFIPNPNKKRIVDHKDNDNENNHWQNLRWGTDSENARNVSISKANTSGFKGVKWRKQRNIWIAVVQTEGKAYHCGSFQNKEDAARAYDKKAKELFGEFANLNFKE